MKQVKCLLGGRECSTCGRRRGQTQRDPCPRGSLNHLRGASLPGFLWPGILLRPVLSLCLVYLGVLPGGFPSGSAGRESACRVGYPGSIPGLGRSPEGGNGNPLQHSCQCHPLDRGTWWATYSPSGRKDTTERLALPFRVLLPQELTLLESLPGLLDLLGHPRAG